MISNDTVVICTRRGIFFNDYRTFDADRVNKITPILSTHTGSAAVDYPDTRVELDNGEVIFGWLDKHLTVCSSTTI